MRAITAIVTMCCAHSAAGYRGLSPLSARRVNSPAVRMVGEGMPDFELELDGTALRVGIIKARWNEDITTPLVQGCRDTLKEMKVAEENIFETSVPGSFELPLASRFLALSGTTDVIIAVGCLIDGDTTHFDVISNCVAKGLMDVGLQTVTPVVFGVLTCNTHEQAVTRSSGENNHGIGWAKSAVEMGLLRASALGKFKQGTMGFSVAGGDPSDVGAKGPPQPGKVGF